MIAAQFLQFLFALSPFLMLCSINYLATQKIEGIRFRDNLLLALILAVGIRSFERWPLIMTHIGMFLAGCFGAYHRQCLQFDEGKRTTGSLTQVVLGGLAALFLGHVALKLLEM